MKHLEPLRWLFGTFFITIHNGSILPVTCMNEASWRCSVDDRNNGTGACNGNGNNKHDLPHPTYVNYYQEEQQQQLQKQQQEHSPQTYTYQQGRSTAYDHATTAAATATTTTSSSASNTNIDTTKHNPQSHNTNSNDIAVPTTEDGSCMDQKEECEGWAFYGECQNNQVYMHKHCRKSCQLCSPQDSSVPDNATTLPRHGEDLGVAQVMTDEDGTKEEDIHFLLHKARNYMNYVAIPTYGEEITTICQNKDAYCAQWALDNWCETDAEFMKAECAPVCGTCHVRTIDGRCPIDPNAYSAWKPGDLDAMFTKLTSEPTLSQYDVQILSSPDTTGGPWVVTLENFLPEQVTDRIIQHGHRKGFERSTDVGNLNADGTFERTVNNGRTSSNTWCYADCESDELIKEAVHRLHNLTEIPYQHSEYMQLLHYERDQYYRVHHDYIPFQKTRQEGCRVLTAFLYLNDVEAGGGTWFDRLDITVTPRRGRALLWPSVLNESPHEVDPRTTHSALPVEKGVKYGANAWFHQHDFKTPNSRGCA